MFFGFVHKAGISRVSDMIMNDGGRGEVIWVVIGKGKLSRRKFFFGGDIDDCSEQRISYIDVRI